MLLRNVKVGDRLEITQKVETKDAKSYVSQVEQILDNGQIVIHMPISYGHLIKLENDKKYLILFYTDKGMLRFDADVLKHTVEEGFNLTVINILSEGVRVQRREFFRFTCAIPTKFSLAEKTEDDDIGLGIVFEGVVKDLGGGGMRFVSNQELKEETKIKSIVMLGGQVIVVTGRILHKQYLPKTTYKFQYRLEFVGMQKSEQEKIVQYIFEQQRKILQKTKI